MIIDLGKLNITVERSITNFSNNKTTVKEITLFVISEKYKGSISLERKKAFKLIRDIKKKLDA